jgi:Fe-S-cluster containining protein
MMHEELSLHGKCSACDCCSRDTPLVSSEERKRIVEFSGRDYFSQVRLASGVAYHIIGRNRDGTLRDTTSQRCPYLDDDRRCSVQEVKPLDCLTYPIKPTPLGNTGRLTWLLDTRCSAARGLSKRYVRLAMEAGRRWIRQFPREVIEDYIRRFTRWPLGSSCRHLCTGKADRERLRPSKTRNSSEQETCNTESCRSGQA